jgi:phosphoketolase
MKAANWVIPWSTPLALHFDNPDRIVACIIGDGEALTGALATNWHSNKFLKPVMARFFRCHRPRR